MTRRTKIRAAGAVVLRGNGDEVEVLMIHRPAYDDWTLPKGKGGPDELGPQTAFREVLEETGVTIRIGLCLPSTKYELPTGPKTVDYWRAEPLDQRPRQPDAEVDQVRWFAAAKAMRRLSYADERRVLSAALRTPRTTPLLLVRHAKAMLRKDWTGPDQERRLSGRGRRQARGLIPLLASYGVERLVSSPSTRCVDTLQPYAELSGIPVETLELLTEEEGTVQPDDVTRYTEDLFRRLDRPTAICGHRPVLPAMFRGLDLPGRPMVVGEVIAVHRDEAGTMVAVEVHKPTA